MTMTMMMMMMVVAVTVMMMIAWPQHSATRPAFVRKPLEEPFHLPTIWQPHRGMKHVCVAECSRPMPVIHLEIGQQAVRSRVPPSSASHPEGFQATSGGRRLQNLPPDVIAVPLRPRPEPRMTGLAQAPHGASPEARMPDTAISGARPPDWSDPAATGAGPSDCSGAKSSSHGSSGSRGCGSDHQNRQPHRHDIGRSTKYG